MKARLTARAFRSSGQQGFNEVMEELSKLIQDGQEKNEFLVMEYRGDTDESSALHHTFFNGKDSRGISRGTNKQEYWWYKPSQWEEIGLESEAVEL